MNLVANAIDTIDKHDKIVITTDADTEMHRVSITNTLDHQEHSIGFHEVLMPPSKSEALLLILTGARTPNVGVRARNLRHAREQNYVQCGRASGLLRRR